MAVTAATVANALRSEATRVATLVALEALAPPIPSAVALAAAPALVDAMATETQRAAFDRCGLLLARLLGEAAPDPAAVYGVRWRPTRGFLRSRPAGRGAAARAFRGAAADVGGRAELCVPAMGTEAPAFVRGARGGGWAHTVMEYFGIVSFFASALRPFLPRAHPGRSVCAQVMSAEPIVSQKKMPSDDVRRQMQTLLVELLRSGELPELTIGGAWRGVECCVAGRPGLGAAAMELGVIELAAEHLRAIGSPADNMASISRGKAGRGQRAQGAGRGLHCDEGFRWSD